jgi:uncharacterized membrane protein
MALDATEVQVLKDLAQLLVDKELGPLLADLIAKLPATYAPIVGMLEQAMLPAITAALDAKIAAL